MSEFEDYLHGESKVDSMTNPYDAAREVWQHQQAKIDELQERVKELELINFDSELHFDAAKEHIDELQKRIDEALKMMDAESSNSWGLWKEKADMYEQGASDAYEKSYWILKGNKDE